MKDVLIALAWIVGPPLVIWLALVLTDLAMRGEDW